MHRLNELAAKLSPSQLKEVEDFAESLVARGAAQPRTSSLQAERPISFEGWAGCLAHIHPELSDTQFNELILDEMARKAEGA